MVWHLAENGLEECEIVYSNHPSKVVVKKAGALFVIHATEIYSSKLEALRALYRWQTNQLQALICNLEDTMKKIKVETTKELL